MTVESLLARSTVYRLMSMLFRHPDAEVKRWFEERDYRWLPQIIGLPELARSDGVKESSQLLVDALDSTNICEWRSEHEKVFGHSILGPAPPYELEYGEEHSHRQPQELGDIGAFYQAFGLRVATAAHERVDHIVPQCEFLHFLLYKQACAVDDGLGQLAELCEQVTRQFLADHLGRWGAAFALRLARTNQSNLLARAGDMLFGWLTEECEQAGVTLGAHDLPLRSPEEKDLGCTSCALAGNADALQD